MQTIEWWLDKLHGVRPVGDGYVAFCPAHRDEKNRSLSIKAVEGGVLVNCFKGCSYREIEAALTGESAVPKLRISFPEKGRATEARLFWPAYTQIPAEIWEGMGCRFQGDDVIFYWDEVPTEKCRNISFGKKFLWRPEGSPRPFFWPSVPLRVKSEVWIAEGESDAGILRYLGFEAFGITKGAESANSLEPAWKALKDRGCTTIVFASDFDSAGTKFLTRVASQLQVVGLTAYSVQLQELIDPFLGEKDIRDLWLRYLDRAALARDLSANLRPLFESIVTERVFVQELLGTSIPQMRWVVDRTLMSQTVGLIVGSPKIGKSWLSLDLGISIASGEPFLGEFKTDRSGPVVYISKEDPEYALQDRAAAIMISKGLGGSVTQRRGGYEIRLPSSTLVPLILDLSRGFMFTPEHLEELILYLRALKEGFGNISAVIFDPILKMIGMGIDEFKVSEVNNAVFEPAFRIVKEVETSVLLVHHRSKSGQMGKGSYGSIAFHAFADSTLYIQGDAPDENGWVQVHNEFKSAPEFDWGYKLDLGETYKVTVDTIGRRRIFQEDLVEYLKQHPKGSLVSTLDTDFSDIDIMTIRFTLKQLEKEGRVFREKEQDRPAGSRGGPKRDLWYATDGTN